MKHRVWLELSLLEHWGPKPHGIPRVSQNVFRQSLKNDGIGYFFFDRQKNTFVVPNRIEYFLALSEGNAPYADTALPGGDNLADRLVGQDRVLFSEAGWDHAHYLAAVQDLRARFPDAVFEYLLCDLIPVKFPHFFESQFADRARKFMLALPSFCDRYVCISNSTAKDVRAILRPEADARVFRLGSDIVENDNAVVGAPQTRPYVLSVGTIEIRKNHLLLYFVWRRLSELLGDRCPDLILVGRQGWIAGDVYTLFQTDPMVKHLVQIRHDVTNEQLAGLIQNCQFTVFPSFYEGWGLPASESFFYGKVCVTSNTSSLPEINPFPELMFDPYDHQQAFEVIRSLIANPAHLKQYEEQIPARFEKLTWEESFAELYKIVEA